MNGTTHPFTTECIDACAAVTRNSFTFGITRSMEDGSMQGLDNIPDGIIVEVRVVGWKLFCFSPKQNSKLDSRRSSSKQCQFAIAHEKAFAKPMFAGMRAIGTGLAQYGNFRGRAVQPGDLIAVKCVVMDEESYVIFHILKGNQELNGKRGVILDFDENACRYKVGS